MRHAEAIGVIVTHASQGDGEYWGVIRPIREEVDRTRELVLSLGIERGC